MRLDRGAIGQFPKHPDTIYLTVVDKDRGHPFQRFTASQRDARKHDQMIVGHDQQASWAT